MIWFESATLVCMSSIVIYFYLRVFFSVHNKNIDVMIEMVHIPKNWPLEWCSSRDMQALLYVKLELAYSFTGNCFNSVLQPYMRQPLNGKIIQVSSDQFSDPDDWSGLKGDDIDTTQLYFGMLQEAINSGTRHEPISIPCHFMVLLLLLK